VEELAQVTLEGIELAPLHRGASLRQLAHLGSWPGQPPYLRGAAPLPQPPRVRAELAASDPASWNALARAEIAGGLGSLALRVEPGLSVDALGQLLHGIDLRATEVVLEAADPLAGLALLEPRLGPDLRLALACDPFAAAETGGAGLEEVIEAARRARQRGLELRVAMIDGGAHAEAGGHAIHELAFALASGAELLRAGIAAGLGGEELARRLELRLSVGPRYFTEVAKLRAARWLWHAVAGALGAGARSVPIAARPNRFLLSALDPCTNLIRIAIACAAALAGGAETIVAQPYDEPLGEPDAHARRIARNQVAVLVEEGYLRRVVDPAGGSYLVEALTDALARRAWTLFQAVEARGGMLAALRDGFVQTELARAREERAGRVARREDPLVGVSAYANPAERPARRSERHRAGAGFEELRAHAERQRAATGRAPRAIVLRAGPAGKLRARVEFARGVLEAGGLAVAELGCDAPAPAACLEALRTVAPLERVVLCALDADLGTLAAPLADALAGSAPPARLVVAARPPESAEWRAAIDRSGGFIHQGADLVAALRRLHEVRP
jgi:methylmalonyl-CoA mutase